MFRAEYLPIGLQGRSSHKLQKKNGSLLTIFTAFKTLPEPGSSIIISGEDLPMILRAATSLSIVLSIVAMAGCTARDYGVYDRRPATALNCCTMQPGNSKQKAIAGTAARLVGARTIQTGNRLISYDCAGVARAIYLSQGTDLYGGVAVHGKPNGVRLIYEHVRKYGRVHQGPAVRPGDLVFFDNTWDANEDGMFNDLLTHVGVVEGVEPDGTVVFISRVSHAVERYRMNLRVPNTVRASDGRTVNDYLRRRKSGEPAGYLASHLFAGFGAPAD
jgi:hypothetical protein